MFWMEGLPLTSVRASVSDSFNVFCHSESGLNAGWNILLFPLHVSVLMSVVLQVMCLQTRTILSC